MCRTLLATVAHCSRNKNQDNVYVWNFNFTRAKPCYHKHHAGLDSLLNSMRNSDTPTSTPVSEVWKKECEALSPVELVYFSSSTTGHPGAAGFGVCRTLVLVALLYFSSPKRFSQVGDHSSDHFSVKYVPVKQWEMALLCQWENGTQHNTVLKRLLFPQRVNGRAEERYAELQDYPQLPNICFLPLHVKSKGVASLYKHGRNYSPEAATLLWWSCGGLAATVHASKIHFPVRESQRNKFYSSFALK